MAMSIFIFILLLIIHFDMFPLHVLLIICCFTMIRLHVDYVLFLFIFQARFNSDRQTKKIEMRATRYYSPSDSYISITSSTDQPKV